MPTLVLKILQGKINNAKDRYTHLTHTGDSPLITNGDGGLGKRIQELVHLKAIAVDHDQKSLRVLDCKKLLDYAHQLAMGIKMRANPNKAAIIFALAYMSTEDIKLKQNALEHLNWLYIGGEQPYKKSFLSPTAKNHALTLHAILNHLSTLLKHNKSTTTETRRDPKLMQSRIEFFEIGTLTHSDSSSDSDSESEDENDRFEVVPPVVPPLELSPPQPDKATMDDFLNSMHKLTKKEKIIYDEDVIAFKQRQKTFFLEKLTDLDLAETQKLVKHMQGIQKQEDKDYRFNLIRMEVGILRKHLNEGFGDTATWQELSDAAQKALMNKLESQESNLLSLPTFFDNLFLVSQNKNHFFWQDPYNRQIFLDRFIMVENKNKPVAKK